MRNAKTICPPACSVQKPLKMACKAFFTAIDLRPRLGYCGARVRPGRTHSANLKRTEKAGRFAVVDFMRIMLKNAVAAPREHRLKNEVRGNAVIRQFISVSYELTVAPHAGAWIETKHSPALPNALARRPPCGGVD